VFLQVALQAVGQFGVDIRQRHLDATSVSVEGTYAVSGEAESAESLAADASTETVVEPTPIRLCQGYARDHRPDLKTAA